MSKHMAFALCGFMLLIGRADAGVTFISSCEFMTLIRP